jgi:GntR family transcriptional regulator, transcriptional repressor for pyruvate dehydrogenase complex
LTAPGPPQPSIRLSPVTSTRVSDVVAERLEALIRDGSLCPGDRLPTEHELARQLGVGRTSVREGLGRLRALGLVEVRKGLGAFVAQPPAGDPLAEFARWTAAGAPQIEGLAEARIALEALAAALAAGRAGPEELERIDAGHRAHLAAADEGDVAALVRTDEAFHDAIMAAGGNPIVRRLYDVLIAELTDFRRGTLALPWAPARSVRGHAAILDAIRRGDAAAARGAMIEHLWVLYTEVGESAPGGVEGPALAPREAFG